LQPEDYPQSFRSSHPGARAKPYSGLRKNYLGMGEFHSSARLGQQKYIAQDAQKGRPARPQRAKRRGVRFGTVSL
jgi:hypothetical protein